MPDCRNPIEAFSGPHHTDHASAKSKKTKKRPHVPNVISAIVSRSTRSIEGNAAKWPAFDLTGRARQARIVGHHPRAFAASRSGSGCAGAGRAPPFELRELFGSI